MEGVHFMLLLITSVLVVVDVFTRGQIEDSRVWRLMRLMSVMMHNSDLGDILV